MTQPEGQTARDIFPEDEGLPEVANDDSPTSEMAEDPEFAPLPGERPGASADFGTTVARAGRGRVPRRPARPRGPRRRVRVRAGGGPAARGRTAEQDLDTTPPTDSGTERTADDIEATADAPVGGEGPEESAVHITDG